MPLNQKKNDELKQLIDECTEFEGRYYLLHLYQSLIHSKESFEDLEATADQLIALITNIIELKNHKTTSATKIKAIQNIAMHYSALANETGASGIFYKSKQALLDLGGLIIGLISAAFGAIIGSIALGISDIIHFRLPTGTFVGAFTGLLVGYTIGQRVPHKLFKDSETRLIRHAVTKLETTFESLFKSQESDTLEEIKNEILEAYFQGNQEQFNAFLKDNQKYEIIGTEAPFFSNKLKGTLGHHSFIKFTINDSEKPKLIEMGLPSDESFEYSQREQRETTGERLVHMLAMHKVLHPQYELSFGNIHNFSKRYKAGTTDCHTYIDKVLLSAGEPESHIKRFTNNDTFIGRFIGSALRFFTPLPEKLDQSESTCDCAVSNP